MSRPGPFRVMIQNWKTSIVAVPVTSFCVWYAYDYTSTRAFMRVSCNKAATYGDKKIGSPNAATRHITVILNPIAGKGKSKKLYEKWVEPLLHLAGIKVSLVETQSPNEAFELMKIMANCDGVAIVGGDGTVHEAINGLLQRPDRVKAAKHFPIGIIPTGQYNSVARYVHQGYVSYRNQKEFIISATVKLVESTTTKFDTLKITPLDEDAKSNEQPIYALRDVRYGIYQDNFFKISGYYTYQTFVKPIWLRLQRMFSSKFKPPQIDAISFTEQCIGCKRCYDRHKLRDDVLTTENEDVGSNRRWWNMIAPVNRGKSGPTEEEKRELELSKRDNPDCGTWINVGSPQEVSDFRASMMGDKKVRLSLGRLKEYNPSDITETQDVKLILKAELEEKRREFASRKTKAETNDGSSPSGDKEAKKEEKPVQFLVDGQATDAQSVEITALSEAITVFTGHYK